YLVFFNLAPTGSIEEGTERLELGSGGSIPVVLLMAISLGSVFMGAMTYIGNGPNFMVKAIAEHSGVKMPSFIGYVFKYSIPVLIPVFVLVVLVFMLF
ncbi:MAG: sodium:proton antiporter, partial [Phycisphaerales bacterium]|nr:sodium:proton antiporter [Phycisphaerales bacterium]